MKAVYFEKTGGPDVLRYGDLPDPMPAEGEVLVNIHAASINGVDWRIRSGRYKEITNFPFVLGRDFSGVVDAVGAGVDKQLIGTAVFGVCNTTQDSAYAEKISISQKNIACKPDWISHEEAAALALTGLTAIVSIEETLQLQKGERILIQGGAGGVGSFAIQLARHLGATVVTTASESNHEYLKALGANEVIDYQKFDFTSCVSDCDAVLDTIGGEVAERSFRVLRSGGRAAFIASGPEAPQSPRKDIRSLRPQVTRELVYLERILSLVRIGAVKMPAITLFHLSEAVKAHQLSESRHFRGKLVFRIRDAS